MIAWRARLYQPRDTTPPPLTGPIRHTRNTPEPWGKGEDKYLVVVTDHDRGTIAWIAEGRCQETVGEFFDALGPERSKLLTHVSADGAEWIHDVVRETALQAKICLDAFHVVKWAGDDGDEVTVRVAAELRAAGKEDPR